MGTIWYFIFLPLGLCAGTMLLFTLISRLTEKDKRRRKRLEILEEALKRGDMDRELRAEVVDMLRSEGAGRPRWRHLSFTVGWFGLFAAGALLLFRGDWGTEEAGWITLIGSMALVTLPLALKELDARRAPDGSVS